ncbi:DUF1924 domain-containing protein [Sulfuricystis multivorans]|uniref:DUF1924 domain-containing protein n=1 Tax=Sulfuricystis multivorans TaxID=2211108 RepID=UPI000F81A812|nr:DUF1924 domain-containing protein [Sulfuricystis multivorans]
MKAFPLVILSLAASTALAATPAELLATYRAEAAKVAPNFQPSAGRGAEFFARRFGISAKMPACTSCHTEKPTQAGRHVVTDKAIKPMAPAANSQRFTDLAKTEKWFGRNCKEVVGRECTAAEKADFVAFMMEARP